MHGQAGQGDFVFRNDRGAQSLDQGYAEQDKAARQGEAAQPGCQAGQQRPEAGGQIHGGQEHGGQEEVDEQGHPYGLRDLGPLAEVGAARVRANTMNTQTARASLRRLLRERARAAGTPSRRRNT